MEFNKYPDIELFEQGLSTLEIDLNNDQKQQFIDYYEMLVEWNKVMNLTAITEFSEVIQKHFIDSLSLVKVLRPTKEKIIDIGTGAGFPGIPLKIAFPDIEIVLLDSLNKRINFLNEVIKKLNLKKIQTLHGRAEDFGRNNDYRENFDLCLSRAVAKLSSLTEYCIPYVKNGGYFIPYKSGSIDEELNMASNALKNLNADVKDRQEFLLPGSDITRTLVLIQKIDHTPKKYPRSAGKPTKEPL